MNLSKPASLVCIGSIPGVNVVKAEKVNVHTFTSDAPKKRLGAHTRYDSHDTRKERLRCHGCVLNRVKVLIGSWRSRLSLASRADSVETTGTPENEWNRMVE